MNLVGKLVGDLVMVGKLVELVVAWRHGWRHGPSHGPRLGPTAPPLHIPQPLLVPPPEPSQRVLEFPHRIITIIVVHLMKPIHMELSYETGDISVLEVVS